MDISTLLCSDGYFLYNKTLAKKLGPGEAIVIGLFCSKYNYYKQRGELLNIDGKEYFFCVRSWIENETGLKEDKQRAIIQSLQVYGILEVKKLGMPAKNYYCLNFAAILQCFENTTTSAPEMPPQVVGNSELSNNNTIIPKGIKANNKKEDNVEGASTSHNSTPLENFRKTYIISGDSKESSRKDVVAEVIAFMNKVGGKNYRAETAETIKMISARLNDGYTVEDMKKVIEHRWELWQGTDMEQYFRPNTIFRPG